MRTLDLSRPFSRAYGLTRGRISLASHLRWLASDGRPGLACVPFPGMTWADTARTTPATVGGPVELVDSFVPGWPPLVVADISYRGTYVVQEGPYGRPCYGVEWDGLDDRMASALPVDFSGASRVTLMTGLTKRLDTNAFSAISHGGTAAGGLEIDKAGSNAQWSGSARNPGLLRVTKVGVPAPDTAILTFTADRGAGRLSLDYNGVEASALDVALPTAFLSAPVSIGARASGTNAFPGTFWGIVAAPLSPAEIAVIGPSFALNTPVEYAA
jgi:hypothetical protein